MCLRKRVFWSEVSASIRAREITESGQPMKYYQCPNCHQWHLARQQP